MALYKCPACGKEKELHATTLCIVNGKARVKEALCGCGEYMESTKEFDGYPTIHRNESDTSHMKSIRK
jgi:transcription elongation factor Elf1